jgi:hypothetical protein
MGSPAAEGGPALGIRADADSKGVGQQGSSHLTSGDGALVRIRLLRLAALTGRAGARRARRFRRHTRHSAARRVMLQRGSLSRQALSYHAED